MVSSNDPLLPSKQTKSQHFNIPRLASVSLSPPGKFWCGGRDQDVGF